MREKSESFYFCQWFEQEMPNSLHKYLDVIAQEEYDNFECFLELDEETLQDDVKIQKRPHLKQFLGRVEKFKLLHEEFKKWLSQFQISQMDMNRYLELFMSKGIYYLSIYGERCDSVRALMAIGIGREDAIKNACIVF